MLNLPLKTLFIGQSFKLLPQCQSTNTELLNLVASNPALPEGFTLQAEHQTQGRGQRGNIWEAASGQNLTFSVLLKPHFLQVAQQYWITISTSLAILDLLTELPLTEVKIKWPNDIFVEGNKIGGILEAIADCLPSKEDIVYIVEFEQFRAAIAFLNFPVWEMNKIKILTHIQTHIHGKTPKGSRQRP